MFEWLGQLVHRRRWVVLALSGAFLVLSLVLLLRGGDLTTPTVAGLEAERADQLVQEVLGHPMDTTFVAVFQGQVDSRDQTFHEAMSAAVAPLKADPRVLSVVTPDDAPTFMVIDMVNGPAHAALALVTLRGDVKEAGRAYPAVRALLRSDKLAITCTGYVPFEHDIERACERDLIHAELLSLPLALIVLLYVFRTFVAALLPVGIGALSVVGGIALVLGLSRHVDMASYTINICSLVGTGVAIDYSLFTVSRYREELASGKSYEDALVRTMATAGRVVAFSGIAVATGFGGLLFFEGSYLSGLGVGGGVVVALSVVFALTFLPALLAVLGSRIHAGRIGRKTAGGLGGLVWARMARWVMARPLAVLAPTLAVLLIMGVPFLHLQLGATDARVLTKAEEARRGYELLHEDFKQEAATRILVAVQFPTGPGLTKEHVGTLYDVSRRIGALPHVLKVQSMVDGDEPLAREDYQDVLINPSPMYAPIVEEAKKLAVGERVILLTVLTDAKPESKEARDLVKEVRRLGGAGASLGAELVVGGQTARDLDVSAYVEKRAPRAMGFVIAVTLVALFLLFGSVVLPIKAVLMNLVSISGSFGALVYIFQDGHLFGIEPRPIEPSVPVILFCVLFGLSMDYEVLMLSRIRESYLKSGDNTAAVADGLEKTAGLITSAAAIMVAVFGAFALAQIVIVKAIGFGMALAVALDATLVRVLLVPSTMRLFGDLNWWAPKALLALRARLGFDAPHD
jgi:RND superfamily putative drug exporter